MSKKTILIADDEYNIRLLVRNILSGEYNLVEATDGRQAIQVAKISKPDLILMDIMMPEIDGYTAINAFKHDKELNNTPIIVLTGANLPLNQKFAMDLGANGYISKPFKKEELIKAIKEILGLN